jgi:hypothetical protein
VPRRPPRRTPTPPSTCCAPARPRSATSTRRPASRRSPDPWGVTGPVAALKPNSLAGTGVDPLDNGVGTQLADFQPLTSKALTGPVAQAQSIGSIPVIGQATGLLGG